MITAKDALTLVNVAQKRNMKEIYKLIVKASNDGIREITVPTLLMPTYINELKAIGYLVQASERLGGCTKIAW